MLQFLLQPQKQCTQNISINSLMRTKSISHFMCDIRNSVRGSTDYSNPSSSSFIVLVNQLQAYSRSILSQAIVIHQQLTTNYNYGINHHLGKQPVSWPSPWLRPVKARRSNQPQSLSSWSEGPPLSECYEPLHEPTLTYTLELRQLPLLPVARRVDRLDSSSHQ